MQKTILKDIDKEVLLSYLKISANFDLFVVPYDLAVMLIIVILRHFGVKTEDRSNSPVKRAGCRNHDLLKKSLYNSFPGTMVISPGF